MNLATLIKQYNLKELPGEQHQFSFIYDGDEEQKVKEELEFILKKEVVLLRNGSAGPPDKVSESRHHSSADVIEHLMEQAILLNTSDIHIEPSGETSRIRFRVNGLMRDHETSAVRHAALVNQVKVKSDLDIAERRLPQDGRFTCTAGRKELDVRVSVVPGLNGEKVVLRLLGASAPPVLNALGLDPVQLEKFKRALDRKQGLILISGPTGSGKTTTLYSCLMMLNNDRTNIITVEDPVEYAIDRITQVQVKESIGLGFARTIKAFLRQDPDIIMIGEIRDPETAMIAVRAAMTGHLVLSTIHTNSAVDTIDRLRDLGVPSYLIASTLSLSVAQRLIRLSCKVCKPSNDHSLCRHCDNTGYKGRRAFFEVLEINEQLRSTIRSGSSGADLTTNMGHRSMQETLLSAVHSGLTTEEEIAGHLS